MLYLLVGKYFIRKAFEIWNPKIMSSLPHETVQPAEMQDLAMLRKGDCAMVTGLAVTNNAEELATKIRLLELGFAPGECLRVIAESFPNHDPIAVRLGNTTFALRRHEAALIQVVRTAPKIAK